MVGQSEQHLTDTLIDPEQLDNPGGTWTKGEKQEPKCKDAWAALLFGAQFVAIFAVAIALGVPAMQKMTDADEVNSVSLNAPDYYGLIYGCCVAGVFSLLFSALSLAVMSCCPKLLIQISLLFSLVLSGLMVGYCFYLGQIAAACFSMLFFALSLCYAYCVWRRIPFAAANLATGLTAVKTNAGVVVVAYLVVIVSYAYAVLWMVALAGVYDKEGLCETSSSGGEGGTGGTSGGTTTDADGNAVVCQANLAWGYYFLLLLAIFWTQQVFQNTIHVTIAGVVSTWWFSPSEASSCCSSAIRDSFVRATTTSFGSICFGSLLVALVQTVRAMVQNARNNSEGGMAFLLCIVECLIRCVEDLLEYFNKFAYIYVGMYGYSYLEAGKNVMTLFGQKGWSIIISDNLISNVLFLFSLIVGLLTGGVGLLMHEIEPSWFDLGADDENVAMGTAFGLCFLIGIVISVTTLSVVDSSVNTVLVCFAEAPAEFEENHPELSSQMRSAWREVYPAECGF